VTLRLRCVGAAQTVTGSRHIVETEHATILLDCGLFQGRRAESRERNRDLGFSARSIDVAVLSHAHIDHSGALPVLCKQGYTGSIYATPATRDLCAVMLEDAAMIQEADARYFNRALARGQASGEPIEPLYETRDVERALEQMISLPYHKQQRIAQGVWLTFLDAGHVLGSAMVVLDVLDAGEQKRIVFSGDLGRKGLPLLRDPELPHGAHALIMESTYGDREHPPLDALDEELAAVINRTVARRGKVVIPSFALERAQQIVYSLKKLRLAGKIPKLPVYVDSPLTVSITQVFRMHPECYDAEARELLRSGESPFDLDGLSYVSSREDSIAIDQGDEPCVIISASGMCEAGRVLHHLKATIESPNNTVVIVGFQAQHTLGRRIVERRPSVRIFGVDRRLAAEVVVMNGFSAHADQRDLVRFVEGVANGSPLRQIVLVHGERDAQETLRGRLLAQGFPTVHVPTTGDLLEV
jgi:metallo-beta-lactamase family protein